MNRVVMHRFTTGLLGLAPLLLPAGCGPDESQDATEPSAVAAASLGRTMESGRCDTVNAGDGWVNTFMPQATGSFSVTLRGYPETPATPPTIDTVVGLSNGAADAFSDLGPIVRFNSNGNIDARDGGRYVGGFPYTTGVGPFEFKMDVSIPTHRYTVWIRHLDSLSKPFELLGESLRFRDEQSSVMRLDNVGRFTDSAVGDLETCSFVYSAPDACTISSAGAWSNRAFPARSGQVRVEFVASASSASIDAVIGASKGAPTGFTSLAPIVRFRPDGTFDARNGTAYAATTSVAYVPEKPYKFALEIDMANAHYSAMVRDASKPIYDSPYVVIGQDFAFRTEQAHVASLDHLGQFVDGTPGSVSVCNLTVSY